ncbi:MAG: RnfH family protein [Burkholderiaceae bacterium]
MRVVVALGLAPGIAPGRVEQVELELPAGSCVADAVRASGFAQRYPALDLGAMRAAVWGVARQPGHPLRERDRVELLRPLKVDPKEARRLRYQAQRPPR